MSEIYILICLHFYWSLKIKASRGQSADGPASPPSHRRRCVSHCQSSCSLWPKMPGDILRNPGKDWTTCDSDKVNVNVCAFPSPRHHFQPSSSFWEGSCSALRVFRSTGTTPTAHSCFHNTNSICIHTATSSRYEESHFTMLIKTSE